MQSSFLKAIEKKALPPQTMSCSAYMPEKENVAVLVSGNASLFAVTTRNGEVSGRRRFLFDISLGEAVFPPPDPNQEVSWIIVSSPEARLLHIKEEDLKNLATESVFLDDISTLISAWLDKMLSTLAAELQLPGDALNIEAGEHTKITPGGSLRAKEGIVWATFTGGNNLFLGETDFSISGAIPFPLNKLAWLFTEEEKTVNAMDTVSMLKNQNIWLYLEKFHVLAQKVLLYRILSEEKSEIEIVHQKRESEYRTIENSVSTLSTVVETGKSLQERLMFEISQEKNHLMACCRLIGAATKIDFVIPPFMIKNIPSRDPLGDIARASRVRMREVLLTDEWWKKENGSMLAYMKDDGRPVALIQIKHDQYRLHDPAHNKKVVVDKKIAQNLKPFAYIFIRPFPVKALSLKDVLMFGLSSVSKSDMLNVLILGLIGGLLGIVTPIAIGILFSNIIPEVDRGQLYYMTIILMGSALAVFLFGVTQSVAMIRIESKMHTSIQASLWDRLLDLPATFFRRFTSGDLALRALSIHFISQMLSGVAMGTILTGIFSVFSILLLFFYNVRLAFLALVIVLIAIIVTFILGSYQVRYQRDLMDAEGKSMSYVLQMLRGIAKFRVAGAESRAFYRWAGFFKKLRQLTFRARINEILLEVFNNFFPVIATGILFVFVIANSGEGGITPGNFIAFNAAFSGFLLAMISMSTVLITLLNLLPLFERAKPIFETLPEFDDAKIDPGELRGEIGVDNLCFRYDPEGPLILDDISMHIEPGEFIGLVGSSGCGKSTLLRCLLGFEKWESGMIYYDGHSIDSIDISVVRRLTGVVLQSGKLMASDIFTNICGSSPTNTLDDAWDAARGAGLEDDIREMPMGMHTFINEGATTISGGQRQRLLIARAIVNRPRIVFFDEATSALDNKTQAVISRTLENLQATRIVIAHRLSTIINADKILVMDKGRIVQSGTYGELINQEGLFKELAKRQLA